MTHWLDVFQYEVRQQFRRKAYLFVTFVLPVLALAGFFGYRAIKDVTNSSSSKQSTPVSDVNKASQTIGYVDLTPQHLFPAPGTYPVVYCTPSQEEINAIGSDVNLTATRDQTIKRISSPYCQRDNVLNFKTFEQGKTALNNNAIDALYVFESDFYATGDVSVYVNGFNIEVSNTETLLHDYMLRSLLYNVDAQQYAALYLRLRDPAFVMEHTITETGATQQTNESRDFLLVYGFGLMLMMTVFWGGGYLMQSVVQEKESRIIEIMLSSVRPLALLLGKILAMGVLSLLQVATIAGAFVVIISQAGSLSTALGDVSVSPGLLAMLAVYFVLGFLLFGSLMAGIGAVSTTMRESQNFVTVVTLPAMIPMFFITIFTTDPNGTFAVVFSMIPITAPLSMIMRLAVTDVPLVQLAVSMILLLLGIAGAIWFSARLFRVNTLLMGHMPRMRDLPRLLRG